MKILKNKSYELTPEQHAEVEKMMAEARAAVPEVLCGLVWESGQMYYVDDNGNRIDKLVDIKAVTEAMIDQMPKTPLKVNGVDTVLKRLSIIRRLYPLLVKRLLI